MKPFPVPTCPYRLRPLTLGAALLVTVGSALLSPLVALAQAPAAPAAAPVAPAETPEQLLKRVDVQANAFKDATFRFKLRILDPAGARESEFTTQQKGIKRIVRFLSPANVKGMGVLVENADTMYVLLPEFNNRVRRVGTHQAGQSFMGSDVSNEDMSLTELLPTYEPSAGGSDGSLVVLNLKVRAGKAVEFPLLKLWIEPKDALIAKIEYMDASGKKLRTQERLNYTKDSPQHSSPGKMVFTDHRKNHQTELVLVQSQLDQGLSDDNFTQRALTRL